MANLYLMDLLLNFLDHTKPDFMAAGAYIL